MEFFRENKKRIILVIAITFIVFTIAPIIMTMIAGIR